MATDMMTRGRLLLALRRALPGASLRRLGDLIDAGDPRELAADQPLEGTLAFGIVLQGSLRLVVGNGSQQHMRAGDTFGLAMYALSSKDSTCNAVVTSPKALVLLFSHSLMQQFGLTTPVLRAFGR